MHAKTVDVARESIIPGEGQIVRVAGVLGAGGLRQSGESAIDAIGAEIREGGRGGRTLRKVRSLIKIPRRVQMVASD